jgi:lipopolysaccharide transport system ATP-binding protein
MTPAIIIDRVSKQYRLGQRERYRALRDTLADMLRAPVRGVGRLLNGRPEAAPDDNRIWALRDISFDVTQGEVIGIVGRNGAGKSTLLKVLSRITAPTEGHVTIRGLVGSLLEVGTGFHPELSGRENVFLNGAILGMKRRDIARKFDEIVAFAEVERFIDTPVKHYSSGMQMRLAFAVAAHLDPEVLIVDEVLAVGDAEFQKKCLGKMEDVTSQGRTVLFVSHNMEAVLTLCRQGVVLNGGRVSFIGGSTESVHFYQRAEAGKSSANAPHVVWTNQAGDGSAKPRVLKIEILDFEGNPKPSIQTWDDVRFRLHYESPEDIDAGSVILEIRDQRDARLMVMDSGLGLPLKAGKHQADCVIRRLPLSAGDYSVGVGLALSNTGWLWRDTNVGMLLVDGRDVFDSGRPPVHSRMLFAVPHEWSSVC